MLAAVDLRQHPELRQTIRQAIDAALRARIAQAHYERCQGCGRDTDQTGVTAGCVQCSNRYWAARKRAQRHATRLRQFP